MRMVFSISASRISCSGSAAARCGSTGPSRSKSKHSKGMGGLRKGLFSPLITIPSHLLRDFQRKAYPEALGAALRAKIGSESCRESVSQYVEISVGAGSIKKKK